MTARGREAAVANEDGTSKERWRRPVSNLRDQLAARRTIAGELISLANILGRPVEDPDGHRVGRVNDVAVNWEAGTANPRVSGVLVNLNKGLVLVDASEMTLEQSKVHVRSGRITVAQPMRHAGDIALARDVLDHQLVDIEGVQVVRAADVYLRRLPDGWELAGVDVGFQAYARRLLYKRRTCPPPRRAIDWADLQTFVPRAADEGTPATTDPAAVAGTIGGGIQLGSPARDVRKLRAREVAAIISDLDLRKRAHVASLAAPSAAAEALRQLNQKQRDAVLAELSESDRAVLLTHLESDEPK